MRIRPALGQLRALSLIAGRGRDQFWRDDHRPIEVPVPRPVETLLAMLDAEFLLCGFECLRGFDARFLGPLLDGVLRNAPERPKRFADQRREFDVKPALKESWAIVPARQHEVQKELRLP